VLVSTPVSVPKGTCVPVPVKINRPVGMPTGTTSCYEVTITNVGTGTRMTCRGSIYASNVVCPKILRDELYEASTETPVLVQFNVRNTSGGPIAVPFSVMAMPSDMDTAEPDVMSLDGLPPGTPIEGMLALGPNDSTDVEVLASFLDRTPFRFYDVVLAIDADDDGIAEVQTSAGVRYAEHVPPDQTNVLPGGAPQFQLYLAAPNPFRRATHVEYELPSRAQVRVRLYDVGGRRVRTLTTGMREAGHYAFTLAAGGLPAGVYFLSLEVGERSVTRRIVLLN